MAQKPIDYDALDRLARETAAPAPPSATTTPNYSAEDIQGFVRAAAQKHGVDEGLALKVAKAENAYKPVGISTKGAIGPMQLMPGTAADLGVNPNDVQQNIDGGVRYLGQMVKKYGDHRKALAAYNFGPGNVDAGKPWPAETNSYVTKILGKGDAAADPQHPSGPGPMPMPDKAIPLNPNWKPGDELIEDTDDDPVPYWDDPAHNVLAGKYNEALDAWKERGGKIPTATIDYDALDRQARGGETTNNQKKPSPTVNSQAPADQQTLNPQGLPVTPPESLPPNTTPPPSRETLELMRGNLEKLYTFATSQSEELENESRRLGVLNLPGHDFANDDDLAAYNKKVIAHKALIQKVEEQAGHFQQQVDAFNREQTKQTELHNLPIHQAEISTAFPPPKAPLPAALDENSTILARSRTGQLYRQPFRDTGDAVADTMAKAKAFLGARPIPAIPISHEDHTVPVFIPAVGLVNLSTIKAVANEITGQVTPGNAAIIVGSAGLGELLGAAANSPKAIELLRKFPVLAKWTDVAGRTAEVAARTAVPAGFGAAQSAGAIQAASQFDDLKKRAAELRKQGKQSEASALDDRAENLAVSVVTRLVFAAASFAGAASIGRATAEQYPIGDIPAGGSQRTTRLRTAAEESTRLRNAADQPGAGGAGRMAAEVWARQAQRIATEDWAKTFGETVHLDLNGKPVAIEYAGAEPSTGARQRGAPVFRLVDETSGKTLYAGRGGAIQDFLRARGAEAGPPTAESTKVALDTAYSQTVAARAEAQSYADKARNEGQRDLYAESAIQDADARLSEIQKQRAQLGAEGTQLPRDKRPSLSDVAQQHGGTEVKPSTPTEALAELKGGAEVKAPARDAGALDTSAQAHDFSSTQVNLPPRLATHARLFGLHIPDAQLNPDEAAQGIEMQPHVTALYGLHTEDPEPVRQALASVGPITVTLGKASIFPAAETETGRGGAGGSDVLKVDVDSPDLHKINAKLRDLPHTNAFPKYQPHVTIAYLKPGEGKNYAGKEIPGVTGQTITLKSIHFSDRNGRVTEIPLTGSAAPGGVAQRPQSAGTVNDPNNVRGVSSEDFEAAGFRLSIANDKQYAVGPDGRRWIFAHTRWSEAPESKPATSQKQTEPDLDPDIDAAITAALGQKMGKPAAKPETTAATGEETFPTAKTEDRPLRADDPVTWTESGMRYHGKVTGIAKDGQLQVQLTAINGKKPKKPKDLVGPPSQFERVKSPEERWAEDLGAISATPPERAPKDLYQAAVSRMADYAHRGTMDPWFWESYVQTDLKSHGTEQHRNAVYSKLIHEGILEPSPDPEVGFIIHADKIPKVSPEEAHRRALHYLLDPFHPELDAHALQWKADIPGSEARHAELKRLQDEGYIGKEPNAEFGGYPILRVPEGSNFVSHEAMAQTKRRKAYVTVLKTEDGAYTARYGHSVRWPRPKAEKHEGELGSGQYTKLNESYATPQQARRAALEKIITAVAEHLGTGGDKSAKEVQDWAKERLAGTPQAPATPATAAGPTFAGVDDADIIAEAAAEFAKEMGLPAPTKAAPAAKPKAQPARPRAQTPGEKKGASARIAAKLPQTLGASKAKLDAAADAALAELRAMMAEDKGGPQFSREISAQPVDKKFLVKLAVVGARHIASGAAGYDAWAKALSEEAGDVLTFVARKSGTTPEELTRKIHQYAVAVAKQFGFEMKEAGDKTVTPPRQETAAPPRQETAARPAPPGKIPSGTFMNESEIDMAVERYKKHAVLSRATQFLGDLRDETNAHSDGWAYWKLPLHAAAQLMGLIQHPEYATEANFQRSLSPIRAFYTKRGTAAGMKFPVIAKAPEGATTEIPPPHSYTVPITRPLVPGGKPESPKDIKPESPKAGKPESTTIYDEVFHYSELLNKWLDRDEAPPQIGIAAALETWVQGYQAWAQLPTGKGTRSLKDQVDTLGNVIAQSLLAAAGQLPAPPPDLQLNDESYYAPDSENPQEEAVSIYTTAREEQAARYIGVRMFENLLAAVLPEKTRRAFEDDASSDRASYHNAFEEVENAFGEDVADQMRNEIETHLDPVLKAAPGDEDVTPPRQETAAPEETELPPAEAAAEKSVEKAPTDDAASSKLPTESTTAPPSGDTSRTVEPDLVRRTVEAKARLRAARAAYDQSVGDEDADPIKREYLAEQVHEATWDVDRVLAEEAAANPLLVEQPVKILGLPPLPTGKDSYHRLFLDESADLGSTAADAYLSDYEMWMERGKTGQEPTKPDAKREVAADEYPQAWVDDAAKQFQQSFDAQVAKELPGVIERVQGTGEETPEPAEPAEPKLTISYGSTPIATVPGPATPAGPPEKLAWGKTEPSYLRQIPSRAAFSRFLSEAKEVAWINLAYGHKVQVYWHKGDLVRVGDEAAYTPTRSVHAVKLAEVDGWKQTDKARELHETLRKIAVNNARIAALETDKAAAQQQSNAPAAAESTAPAAPQIAVTGKTYPYRMRLRAIGGTWNKAEEAWIFPAEKAAEVQPVSSELVVKPFGAAPSAETPAAVAEDANAPYKAGQHVIASGMMLGTDGVPAIVTRVSSSKQPSGEAIWHIAIKTAGGGEQSAQEDQLHTTTREDFQSRYAAMLKGIDRDIRTAEDDLARVRQSNPGSRELKHAEEYLKQLRAKYADVERMRDSAVLNSEPGAPNTSTAGTPEQEKTFRDTYAKEIGQSSAPREQKYPVAELLKDWAKLKSTGAVTVKSVSNKAVAAGPGVVTTETRTEGKRNMRVVIKSYHAETSEGDKYTYDWQPNGENDWAGAYALSRARGAFEISGAVHSAMVNGGDYVSYHEKQYAIGEALKAAFPGKTIPSISTVVAVPNKPTLADGIEAVAQSLPRNVGSAYDRNHEEKLKQDQNLVDLSIPIVGKDHPRVLELQKLIDEARAAIAKKADEDAAAEKKADAEERTRVEGDARSNAEHYAKFGGEPSARLERYATLSGWPETGEALSERALREFDIEKEQLKPLYLSGVKLTSKELETLREAKLDPGGSYLSGRLTDKQEAQWKERGWLDAAGIRLTELGERAVIGARVDYQRDQNGRPISEYTPGSGRAPAIEPSRFALNSPIPYKGDVWHTDGHFAMLGPPPKSWGTPEPGPHTLPALARVMPETVGNPITPIGFAVRGNYTFLFFSSGAAIDSALYDYVNKTHSPDRWTTEGKESSPVQAWRGKTRVAMVMPLRWGKKGDPLPPGIQEILKRGEASPKIEPPSKLRPGMRVQINRHSGMGARPEDFGDIQGMTPDGLFATVALDTGGTDEIHVRDLSKSSTPKPEPTEEPEQPAGQATTTADMEKKFPIGERVGFPVPGGHRDFGKVERIDNHGNATPPFTLKVKLRGKIVTVDASTAFRAMERGDKVTYTDAQGYKFRASVWDGIPNEEGRITVKIGHAAATYHPKIEDVQRSSHKRDQLIQPGQQPKPEYPQLRDGDVIVATREGGGTVEGNVVTVYGDESVEIRVYPRTGQQPYSDSVRFDRIKSVNNVPVGAEPEAPRPPAAEPPPAPEAEMDDDLDAEITAALRDKLKQPPEEAPKGSFKVVMMERGSTAWTSNGQRWATRNEAENAGHELHSRWMAMPDKWEVVPDDEAPNWRGTPENRRGEPIKEEPVTPPQTSLPAPGPPTGGRKGTAREREGGRKLLEEARTTGAAERLWQGMDDNERAGVRLGLFPAQKMEAAQNEGRTYTINHHDLVVALMAIAASQPAPAKPQPAKARMQTPAEKTAAATEKARAVRRDFYTPGNVIYLAYWREYDTVLEYKENPGGSWSVKVQRSDETGTPTPGERPRLHSTEPDKGDRVISRSTGTAPEAHPLSDAAKAARDRLRAKLGDKPQFSREIRPNNLAARHTALEREHESLLTQVDARGGYGKAPVAIEQRLDRVGRELDSLESRMQDQPQFSRALPGTLDFELEQLGIDRDTLKDLGVIGAEHMVVNKATAWDDWAKRMNEDLGEAPDPARRDSILRLVHKYATSTARKFGVEADTAPPAQQPAPADSYLGSEDAKLIASFRKIVHGIVQNQVNNVALENNIRLMEHVKSVTGEAVKGGDTKHIYDLLETAINQEIAEYGAPMMAPDADVFKYLRNLRFLLAHLPTQNIRSEEQVKYQQFSTPPSEAYIAARVLAPTPDDLVLESSAGNGGLAAFVRAAGARVLVNEISPGRAQMLRKSGYLNVGTVDAEQIDNAYEDIWPDEEDPTLVLINPPFSAAGERGVSNSNDIGYRHVLQALQRLKPGGRLVAILGGGNANPAAHGGEGASLTAQSAQEFWRKVRDLGTVRANVKIDGKEYAKYGTTFSTRIVVIDKVPAAKGAPQSPVTGDFDTLEKVWDALRPIAADRQSSSSRRLGEDQSRNGGSDENAGRSRGSREPGGESGTGVRGQSGRDSLTSPIGNPASRTGRSPGGEPDVRLERPAEGAGTERGGSTDVPASPGTSLSSNADAVVQEQLAQAGEDIGDYTVYRALTPPEWGAQPHKAVIVETQTMASMPEPVLTAKPNVPQSVIDSGDLSAVQLAAISHTLAAHERFLDAPRDSDGKITGEARRLAFFNGDGTGVGKGRTIAGTALHYWRTLPQGKRKTVWISFNEELATQAAADLKDVGGGDIPIYSLEKVKVGKQLLFKDGVLFVPYSKIAAQQTTGKDGKPLAKGATKAERASGQKLMRRLQQIIDWAGEDPLIILDEAHKCVPAGTMIATPSGPVAIETLKSGDTVLGFNHKTQSVEPSRVSHTFRNESYSPLSRVHNTLMTGNHPVWTEQRGYVRADQISNLDLLLHLRVVQGALHVDAQSDEQREADHAAPLLQQAVLRDVADVAPGVRGINREHEDARVGPGSHAGDPEAAGGSGTTPAAPGREQSIPQAGSATESDLNSGREGLEESERRQRGGSAGSGSDIGSAPELANRGSSALRIAENSQGQPDALPNRHRGASAEDCGGARWSKSPGLDNTGGGPAQGNIPASERLDRSPIPQPGSPHRIRLCDLPNLGSRVVYNIATDTGNYFANGLLVHNCKNATPSEVQIDDKRKATKKPTLTGLAAIELQNKLPRARVLYSSATGFSDVANMAYANRLGVWGPGTSFKDFQDFRGQVDKGGIAMMELVARDLKAQGKYLSRFISYQGVVFDENTHEITAEQHQMLDRAGEAWRTVIDNFRKAAEFTTENTEGASAAGAHRRVMSQAMSQLWGAELRFYRSLYTAMKIPTLIKIIDQALSDTDENGKPKDRQSVVISVLETGQAQQDREIERLMKAGDEGLEGADVSPVATLLDMVEKRFPTIEYETVQDEHGNDVTQVKMIKDANGITRPAQNAEALRAKAKLLEDLQKLKGEFPDSALDQIINKYGTENVAEMTKRAERLVRNQETGLRELQSRGSDLTRNNLQEQRAFQNGDKFIAIISNAASTGISLHSSLKVANQRQRIHVMLQLKWSADMTMQDLGRTHRTDQANAPHYILLSLNVEGEKRFAATVARRLEQLGALSRGERKAGSGGTDFSKYNFESRYGRNAVDQLVDYLYAGSDRFGFITEDRVKAHYPSLLDGLGVLGLMGLYYKGEGDEEDEASPDVPVNRFFNRLMILPVKMQNELFRAFIDTMEHNIENAKRMGLFDAGTEIIHALHLNLDGEPMVVNQDRTTGAQAVYYRVKARYPRYRLSWESMLRDAPPDGVFRSGTNLYRNMASGRLLAVSRAGTAETDPDSGRQVIIYHGTAASGSPTRVSDTELGRGGRDTPAKYELVNTSDPKAQADWTEQYNAAGEFVTNYEHLITGSVLPIWSKIQEQKGSGKDAYFAPLKVKIAKLDSGSRLIGAYIEAHRIKRVLKALGHEPVVTAEEVGKGLERGKKYPLMQGGELKRVKVSGEPRFELTGAAHFQRLFRDWGLYTENIGGKDRWFLPAGTGVLARVLQELPVRGEAETETGDTPEFSRSLRTSPETFERVGESPAGGEGVWVEKGKVIRTGTALHAQLFEKSLPGTLFGDVVRKMLEQGAVRVRGENIELFASSLPGKNFGLAVEQAVKEANRKHAGAIALEIHYPNGTAPFIGVPLADVNELMADPARYVRNNRPQFSREIPAESEDTAWGRAEFSRRENTILMNPAGMRALAAVWQANRILGMRLSAGQARAAADTLRVGAPKLSEALQAAAEASADVIVVDSSRKRSEVAKTLRHERFHITQSQLAGHLGAHERELLDHPVAQRMEHELLRAGYRPDQIALEIGSHLAAGQYREFGLSRDDAKELWFLYTTLLGREHGPRLLRAITNIAPIMKGVLNAAAGHEETHREPQQGDRGGQEGPGGIGSGLRRDVSGGGAGPGNVAGGRADAGMGEGSPAFARQPQGQVEPQKRFSQWAAWKDRYVRNLSQLEKANKGAHAAAVQAATSRAQTSALIRASVPRIVAALENTVNIATRSGHVALTAAGAVKAPVSWLDFRRALIESRLRGIRDRWERMAAQVPQETDEDLHDAFGSWLAPVLKAIHEESIGEPLPSPALTAAALLEREDFDGLRDFLEFTFQRSADRVATEMEDPEFRAVTANPGFAAGLASYKNLIETAVAQNHAENEGVFSDALGPLDTYYPLIRLEEEGEERGPGVGRSGRAVPYRRPKNIANMFATGLGEAYDPGMEAFNDRIRQAFRVNNKAALIDTLEGAGLLQKLKKGQEEPEFVTYRGVDYLAVKVEIQKDRDLVTPTGIVHIGQSNAMIPAWLEEELRPILDRNHLNLAEPNSLIARITKYQLAGPLDAVIHSANLIGTLVANTPFLGKSFAGKLLGGNPVSKRFAAIFQLIQADPMSDESAQDIIDMARLGLVPEKYGSEVLAWTKRGRDYAEQTGAQPKRMPFAPFLYGPKGVDIRARLVMYRMAKQMNPGAGAHELYRFVNQLGNYTRVLQGKVERSLKESGWSPFYTAGSTMVRNGVNAWTGRGPMPTGGKGGRGQRVLAAITGGAIGLIAMWLAAHKAYTGKWPWEDPHSKFLAMRLQPKDRASWIARQLWGPPSNGDAYIDLGFFSPLVKRGARALGIAGSYDTARAGGSSDQVMDAAVSGAINAAVHPIMGPPATTAWVGITGTEPYMTGLRDDRGRPMPQFISTVAPQKPGAAGWMKTHVVAPIAQVNSFFGNLAAATGLTKGLITHADDPGNHYLRMLVDMATPQLASRPGDAISGAERLARQRNAMEEHERTILRSQITTAVRDRDMDKARALAQQGVQSGTLSAKDVAQAAKRARLPKDVAAFQALPVAAALEVMGGVTDEERQQFMPVLVKKLRADFRHLPPSEQQRVVQELRNLHITPADIQQHAH